MASETSTTKKVQHNYWDYSQEAEPQIQLGLPHFQATFPVKLHYMLGVLEKEGLSHIVSWKRHGRCFLVHNQKEFAERILPL